MKRLGIPALLALSLILGAMPTSTAAVIQGSKCSKVGDKQTINGLTFTCKKSDSKLLWSQGVKEQGYDAAFAKSYLAEAQAKATRILADAEYSAAQISSAPYCVTGNSRALVSIGGDESTGLRALIFENSGICDITVRASAAFRCDSNLPPSQNTVISTGMFPLRAKEKLIVSYNISTYFPQVLLECRLLTGISSSTVNISRDGQSPQVMTLTSTYTGKFNQVEASRKADLLLKAARTQAAKIVSDAKNPVMIAKAWKALADKALADKAKELADKAAADKAAADKAAADTLAACVLGGSCKVGGTGPGGGIVFYDAGSRQSWGRYLEVAPEGWASGMIGILGKNWTTDPDTVNWCDVNNINFTTSIIDLNAQAKVGPEIGKGKANTDMIIANCKEGAGVIARAYNGGGLTDWYLPSFDELKALCVYVQIDPYGGDGSKRCQNSLSLRLGIVNKVHYWSSFEFNKNNVAVLTFNSGGSGYFTKVKSLTSAYIRPIRAF